jgi:hypothetical protein
VAEVASDAAATVRFGGRDAGRDVGGGAGGEVRRNERDGMGELRVRMRDGDEIDEGARCDTGGMTSELYSTSTA